MSNRLQRLFAPTVFESEEKNRIAQFMTTFSWIAIGVLIILLLSRLILHTDQTLIPTFILSGMIVIISTAQFIINRGHVHAASQIIVLGLWGAVTYLAWRADGIRDASILAYVIIILLASFLLGWRSIIAIGVMSLLAIWFFAISEQQGQHPLHVDSAMSYARDLSGIFILISALIYLLVSGWERTLQAARIELTERLRAEEKLQKQADYLTALHEIALGLLDRSETHPLLESILSRACDMLGTEHGLIELVTPDGSALRQEIGHGVLAKFNGTITQKNEGVTGNVWASGESLVIQNYPEWEYSLKDFVSAGFCAVIGVPLKMNNSVIGVLSVSYVEQERKFSNEQVNLMERFAALAALAIHNARINEQANNEIQERKNAEMALRESESRTRAILNSIPDMIFEISKDGALIDFIESSDHKPLYPPEKFLGKNIKELFPADIAAQTMFALERSIASGQLHAFEYGLPPGEEIQHFEARVAPISEESAIVMVRDISQRKWVETERETLISELEEKNAELERFTYTVSHDLKSPLITIKGFLGFIEQDAASGNSTRLKADIKRISDATDKMQMLLNELLELSRIGRLVNLQEEIPFVKLVQEAIDLVQGQLLNARVNIHIQENLPTVYGDHPRLVETIQNLLDNASKFMGSQPNPQIEIGQAGYEEGLPILFVRDNGMGIEPEHQDRIFGLFNKLDASSDGTGIGLALVKRIIEIHHGRIWVQSEPGKGATFFFTLPTGPSS